MNELLPLITALFAQYLTQTAPLPDEQTGVATAKPLAEANFAAVREKIQDRERFWSAPFVVADLEKKQVTVWGEHTGMNTGEPLEFFVISELSGHDYESLMISFAKPSDIHKALEKIGAEAGHPVTTDAHRFWPRGDRIVAEIEWRPAGAEAPVRMPIEQSALTEGDVMPVTPWVFTGSPMMPDFENEGEMIYGADLYSPNSIASTFNLQSTVFDLPFQGSKTQTYGTYIRNPGLEAPAAQPMLLHLRPATKEEIDTELDLVLRFTEESGEVRVEGLEKKTFPDLAELGAELNRREKEIHYLQPDFGPALPLSEITRLARELQLMESHVDSIRIGPPPAGQLFYKAFVPDPRFRIREQRPSQPIELHLRKSGGAEWTATLLELEEIWGEERRPAVVEKRVPLENPRAFVDYLEDPEKQKPVLFVYTSPTLPHQTLQQWLTPVLKQFPVVFVYTDEE